MRTRLFGMNTLRNSEEDDLASLLVSFLLPSLALMHFCFKLNHSPNVWAPVTVFTCCHWEVTKLPFCTKWQFFFVLLPFPFIQMRAHRYAKHFQLCLALLSVQSSIQHVIHSITAYNDAKKNAICAVQFDKHVKCSYGFTMSWLHGSF